MLQGHGLRSALVGPASHHPTNAGLHVLPSSVEGDRSMDQQVPLLDQIVEPRRQRLKMGQHLRSSCTLVDVGEELEALAKLESIGDGVTETML